MWLEEAAGRPQARLADLSELPAEALARLKPQVCPGVEIIPGQDQVSARLPGAEAPVPLFAADEANLFVFNRFNGQTPIGRIAEELNAALSWPQERSFAHVRGLFLRLVRLQVSVPANPPEEPPGPGRAPAKSA